VFEEDAYAALRSRRSLLNASWQTWEANFPNCSVAISQLTQNTFCLILSNDKRAGTLFPSLLIVLYRSSRELSCSSLIFVLELDSAYLIGNIEAARRHFEEVLGGSGIVRLKCPCVILLPLFSPGVFSYS
jgi:hypothetical protein